ncbi:hypothetical protein [Flocculibacter collagenilyticus]|uniref:hypothetical protein n=1 Tax=Flocculibacter collagenilyticus TaxID=2744479 RepID=UPI0018F38FD0|nr:hypothetical protein [Flocculibacter collagenilyticus]
MDLASLNSQLQTLIKQALEQKKVSIECNVALFDNTNLAVSGTIPTDGSSEIELVGKLTGDALSTRNLSQYIETQVGKTFSSQLPSSLTNAEISLLTLTATCNIDKKSSSITLLNVTFALHTPHTWQVSQPNIALSNLVVQVLCHNPTSDNIVALAVSGTTAICGAVFSVAATLSDASDKAGTQLNITSIEPVTFDLSTLTTQLSGHALSLPSGLPTSFNLNSATLTAQPLLHSFNFTADTSVNWTLPLGITSLSLDVTHLALTHEQDTTTGSLTGNTTLAGAKFDFALTIPGAVNISGTIPKISFKSLLTELAGHSTEIQALVNGGFNPTLENIQVIIEQQAKQSAFYLCCTVPTFGTLYLVIKHDANQSDPNHVIAIFDLPNTSNSFKLSNFSGFPNVLDALSLEQNVLVISDADDPTFQVANAFPDNHSFSITNTNAAKLPVGIHKGMAFYSHLNPNQGALSNVTKLFKLSNLPPLATEISVSTSPLAMELAASLDIDALNIDGLKLHAPALKMGLIAGSPYLGLGAMVEFKVDSHTIQIESDFDVSANGANLTAEYLGSLSWHDVFGIPATVVITEPTIVVGISFEGLPTVGLSGSFQIDQVSGDLNVLFNAANPANSMLAGSLSELTLKELTQTFCHNTIALPTELEQTLSEIGLSNIELYIAPTDVKIGDKTFKADYKFAGQLNILGTTATTDVELDPTQGFSFDANINKPLHIKNIVRVASNDNKTGPLVQLSTLKSNPHFTLSGLISIENVLRANADISISDQHSRFDVTTNIYNVMKASIAASVDSSSLLESDMKVAIDIESGEFDKIAKNINHALKDAAKEANKGLNQAMKDVTQCQADVKKIDNNIKANNAKIKKLQKQLSQLAKGL